MHQTRDPQRQSSTSTSLTALQCELRALFADRPTNRALAEALRHVGRRLGGIYLVVHTRLGVHVLSEEWSATADAVDAEERASINEALWESVSAEEARCKRLRPDGGTLLTTVVMYDGDAEPSGGAALVTPACDRAQALETMARLEGVLGFLSLLVDRRGGPTTRSAARRQMQTGDVADHPMRLAYAILADLEARYGLEQCAVGFVRGNRVRVTAMSGVEALRAANPGVAAVRAAMEECLDRGGIVVCRDRDNENEDDCRLHAQWSRRNNGNPVASLPLELLGETVAVVSMSQGGGSQVTREQVLMMQEELSGYAALVPLSLTANRSLWTHAVDALRGRLRRVASKSRARLAVASVAVAALVGWLALGTLPHTFTVPCTVKASDRHTIACPRAGVLAELFVRPGDRVQRGQLLAAIDASDDFLQRAELNAEIEALAALIDQAVAERRAGDVRVNEAKKRSLEAQLMIVDASITQAQIRASHDGLILTGDLRERLGSRLELGVSLFELARSDRASIELRIPERLVLSARACVGAEFAPAAEPDRSHELTQISIAPSSSIVDERNVFLGEAAVDIDIGLLPPGMEGTALIDGGTRSAWWVLTHRITDWLHLNFWL